MKAVLLVVSLVLMGMPAHGVPGSNEKLVTYQSHQISPLILPDNIRRYVASLGLDEMQGTIADVRYESYLMRLIRSWRRRSLEKPPFENVWMES